LRSPGFWRTSPGSSRSPNDETAASDENVAAADVELTPDDLREIEVAAARITIHGARYPEAMERMSNR